VSDVLVAFGSEKVTDQVLLKAMQFPSLPMVVAKVCIPVHQRGDLDRNVHPVLHVPRYAIASLVQNLWKPSPPSKETTSYMLNRLFDPGHPYHPILE
jgi:hypothetical protein